MRVIASRCSGTVRLATLRCTMGMSLPFERSRIYSLESISEMSQMECGHLGFRSWFSGVRAGEQPLDNRHHVWHGGVDGGHE